MHQAGSVSVRKAFIILSFTLRLLIVGVAAFGQGTMPLRDHLKKLNQKRGLYFLYEPQVIDGHTIAVPTDWNLATEPLLTQLLQGTNLSFRKVGDCYLIEPQAAKPTSTLPSLPPTRRFTVSGFVKEHSSGEQLGGATVFLAGKTGTSTNNYGFFALSLPEGEDVDLIVSLVGYQRVYRRVRSGRDQTLTVELLNNDLLNEVVLTTDASERAWSTPQTSQHTVPMASVRNTPAVAGEKDVLKTLQFLPGIQKGFDGQVGLHVRGGGADQNLLILDEAPVYNANHLFGFVSVFNVDALKSVLVQKGGFSARYGGRLSSVVEMNMREGNKQRLGGELGTGLIASRLLLEGPIIRNKASFHLTARRSNLAPLLGGFVADLADAYTGANWRASFYDLNAKVNLTLNPRNQLYASVYTGRDFFSGGDSLDRTRRWENTIQWGNTTGSVRWNHLFSERVFSNLSLLVSRYDFHTATSFIPYASGPGIAGSTWRHFNGLTDYAVKYDLDYFSQLNHQVRAGFIVNQRSFRLNGHEVPNAGDTGNRTHLETTRSLETSVYAEDDWEVSRRFRVNIGGRATLYRHEGQTFLRAEPRLSLAAKVTDNTTLRGSYAEMNQFVHQLTNTGQGLPTDLWVPATARVKPQHSRQLALALVHDLTSRWQLTLEAYQKWMRHIIGYNPSADFIGLNNALNAEAIRWERNVTSGEGDATGVELMVQRKTGRLSGWVAYTWAITHWRFDELNNGAPYFPAHDRRHTLVWTGTYAIRPTFRVSASWQYSSGNPQSLALLRVPSFRHLGVGNTTNSVGPNEPLFGPGDPLVSARQSVNSFRAEPSHRLDVSVQKTISGRRLAHVFDLTITNLYARRNPFYYELHPDGGDELNLKRVSLFIFLPSLNYTLRF